MAQDAKIARNWPLHWMVWNNDIIALNGALKEARNVSNKICELTCDVTVYVLITIVLPLRWLTFSSRVLKTNL